MKLNNLLSCHHKKDGYIMKKKAAIHFQISITALRVEEENKNKLKTNDRKI